MKVNKFIASALLQKYDFFCIYDFVSHSFFSNYGILPWLLIFYFVKLLSHHFPIILYFLRISTTLHTHFTYSISGVIKFFSYCL